MSLRVSADCFWLYKISAVFSWQAFFSPVLLFLLHEQQKVVDLGVDMDSLLAEEDECSLYFDTQDRGGSISTPASLTGGFHSSLVAHSSLRSGVVGSIAASNSRGMCPPIETGDRALGAPRMELAAGAGSPESNIATPRTLLRGSEQHLSRESLFARSQASSSSDVCNRPSSVN